MHKKQQSDFKLIYELAIVVLLFLLLASIYREQPRISLNDGKGWDGMSYYEISKQIQNGEYPIIGIEPYINRIGTFLLIGFFSRITNTNLLESALLINLSGALVICILLSIWLRKFINELWIRLATQALFMFTWHAPLRFSFYYPMTSDAWGAVFFCIGLLLLEEIRNTINNNQNTRYSIVLLSIVAGIGVFFRESNAVLAIAVLFTPNPIPNYQKVHVVIPNFRQQIRTLFDFYISRKSIWLFLPTLFTLVAKYFYSEIIATIPSDYSYIKTVFSFFYHKSFQEYFLALCISFGPIILLLVAFPKNIIGFFMKRQDILFLFLCIILFSFIGGTDTERIIFMSGFPIIFVLIGITIWQVFHSLQRWWLIVIMFIQILALRIFWYIPDHPSASKILPVPFFTMLGSNFQYSYLYSNFGHYFLNSILLVEYLILLCLTLFILKKDIRSPFHSRS